MSSLRNTVKQLQKHLRPEKNRWGCTVCHHDDIQAIPEQDLDYLVVIETYGTTSPDISNIHGR